MAFVEHEYCAQHGQWTHSEAHEHGEAAAEESDNTAAPLAVVYGQTGFDHEHEHCHALVERRDEWSNDSVDFYRVAPAFGEAFVQWIATPARDLSATYLIAPKASPPRSAA